MPPSDRDPKISSWGGNPEHKFVLGPLPKPPAGSKPAPTPAPAPKPAPQQRAGAPAVGTSILGGTALNLGPGYVPPKPNAAPQGPVSIPRPPPPGAPPPHQPLPMRGVLDAYAKGARESDSWPRQTPQQPPRPAPQPPAAARPAPPPRPPAQPELRPAIAPAEDPGPAPAWMADAETRKARPNRTPLYLGGAALVAVAAVGGAMLLNKRSPEPAKTSLFTTAEQTAPLAPPVATPAAEPLRQEQEVATAEAPPPIVAQPAPAPVVAAKPRKAEPVRTASVTPAPKPAETAPAPVQVTTQPLAIPPPAPVVQQPPPRIVIPHIDPSGPIETRSSADQ